MNNLKSFRHELKYYINLFEYYAIKNRLKNILQRDNFADIEGNYQVRSLYFDDLRNSALYEKQSGNLSRSKFRIRIYNFSDEIIKLEKKSRLGQFIKKESTTINKEQYFKIIDRKTSFLIESNNELLKEFYFWLNSKKMKPDVIVDYEREAYISKINKIRVTFDKNLRTGLNSTDLFDTLKPTIDAIEMPLVILEIKYNNFLPTFIRDIIQTSSSQRYAISKFVISKKYTKFNNWEDN